MICRCGSWKGFAAAQVDGQFCYELWVCEQCRKPTRLVFEKLTGSYAPKDAKALLFIHGRQDGVIEVTWALKDGSRKTTLTYQPYPRKVGMENDGALLQKTWQLLDQYTADIMVENPDPWSNADLQKVKAQELAKHRARGVAEVLAILMRPFFDNPDDIVREAVKRYKAKIADHEHETPGLAEQIWDRNTRWDGTVFSQENERRAKSGQRVKSDPMAALKKLSPKDIEGIRMSLASGMFNEKQLAEVYKVPVETVRSVGAS